MRGRGTWTAVLTWSIKHARRVDQAGNQGRDGAAVRGRERGEGGMAAHGGTARDCGALWQAGTVPRRHERSVAGREAGGGTRGSRELVGGASRVSRQARDERRQTAGRWKASSELRPWEEERLCLVEGGTLARSSGRRCRRPRSSSSGRKYGGGRGTDGGRGVSAVY